MRMLRYHIVKSWARLLRVPVEVHVTFTAKGKKCLSTLGSCTLPK